MTGIQRRRFRIMVLCVILSGSGAMVRFFAPPACYADVPWSGGTSFFIDSNAVGNGTGDYNVSEISASSLPGGKCFVAWIGSKYGSKERKGIHAASIDAGGSVRVWSELWENAASFGDPRCLFNLSSSGNANQLLLSWNYSHNFFPGDLRARRMLPSGQCIDTSDIMMMYIRNYGASMAEGDSVYLFSWSDEAGAVCCSRLSKSGKRLDTTPVVLCGKVSPYALNCTFTVYRSPYFYVFHGRNHVFSVQRISEEKTIVDTTPLLLDTSIEFHQSPGSAQGIATSNIKICMGDSSCLITWIDGARIRVLGFRISLDGKRIDPENIRVTYTTDPVYSIAAISEGVSFLVAWAQSEVIKGARIRRGGDVASLPLAMKGPYCSIAMARGDTSHYILCSDCIENHGPYSWMKSGTNVRFFRIRASGEPIDSSPVLISPNANMQCNPNVAFNGERYLVAWQDCRNVKTSYYKEMTIYGKRFGGSGGAIDTNARPLITKPLYPAPFYLAGGKATFLLTWNHLQGDKIDQHRGTLFHADGGIVHDSIIFEGTPLVFDMGIHFMDTSYRCIWDGFNFSFKSLSTQGNVINNSTIKVNTQYKGFTAVTSAAGKKGSIIAFSLGTG